MDISLWYSVRSIVISSERPGDIGLRGSGAIDDLFGSRYLPIYWVPLHRREVDYWQVSASRYTDLPVNEVLARGPIF
jgi:hypothetical protein